MSPSDPPARFAPQSRVLHWVMAAAILTNLFLGAAMVRSLALHQSLLAIHRPLGIFVLVLGIARYVNRRLTTLPPFLATMSARERRVASASERLLYALMIGLPLVGWAMLSAGSYPIVLFGAVHLPPILPASPMLYAVLRRAHSVLAYALLATILAHLAAVLFHQFVLRDGILRRMVAWWPRGGD